MNQIHSFHLYSFKIGYRCTTIYVNPSERFQYFKSIIWSSLYCFPITTNLKLLDLKSQTYYFKGRKFPIMKVPLFSSTLSRILVLLSYFNLHCYFITWGHVSHPFIIICTFQILDKSSKLCIEKHWCRTLKSSFWVS